MAPTWLLYGANGYTGVLVAEEAVRRGEKPILAGRREDAVRALAERLGLQYRVFELTTPEEIETNLEGVSAVLLCAGPFSATSKPMLQACLDAGVHYLDITGELAVFERVHRRTDEAKTRGVVLLPGVGFDVVPTDCLAASLKQRLPDADRLELAFASEGPSSRGTAKTAIEGLHLGGAIREGGKIKRVPLAWKTATIPFRDKPRLAMTIPWGDVSTAYYSTGIPNIVVYLALPPKMIRSARLVRPFARLLGLAPIQWMLTRRLERGAAGPSAEVRETARSHLWGRATNPAGKSVEATLETPEGYKLTALTSVEAVIRVLEPGAVPPGAHTPSTAFGADFITHFPGCDLQFV